MGLDKKIADLEREIQRLREELITDELTKVRNRKGLFELLTPIVNEVCYQLQHPQKRKNVVIRQCSIIFADVDNFKKINDAYGHVLGDVVLKAVAKLFTDYTRKIDVVGRYGGEEFVVGLIGATKEDAVQVAENLREKIEQTSFKHGKKPFKVTASFGVADLKVNDTLQDVFHRADEAMYKAKKQGKNQVIVAK